MSSQTILIEPELTHEFNLIRRHRTLRIGRMIYPSRRLCGQSISPQIRGDNGEPLRQMRGNFAPHDVRLWGAVEKEKRRAIPTNDSVYRGPKAVNRMGSESRKEGRRLGLNGLQLTLQKRPLREHLVGLTRGQCSIPVRLAGNSGYGDRPLNVSRCKVREVMVWRRPRKSNSGRGAVMRQRPLKRA
jgi:hypothetical protein